MRKPLIFSGLFHVLILVFVLVSFNFWEPNLDEESVIIVAVTDDMEIAKEAVTKPSEPKPPAPPEPIVKPQAEKAPEKQAETKNPEPQRVDEEQAEAAPAPPEPSPIDKPPPPKQVEPVTKDLPNVTMRDKPKPKPQFDPTKIAQLLNKTDNRAPPTPDKKVQKATDPDPSKGSQQNQSPLQAQQARANLISVIASQIKQCWVAPIGATGAETLVVKIRIYLRVDGNLADIPEILDRTRMSDPLYRVAAESAVRAVQRCAPIKRLPPEMYDDYKVVTLNFDPKML